MKIKTIKILNENKEIDYEGQILISDDGSFEGIVFNPFGDVVNSYIVGKYKSLTGKLNFNIVCPESSKDDVLGYSLTKGIRKEEYIGEYTNSDEETRLCCVKVEKIFADKDVKKAQMAELKVILKHYRDTYEERTTLSPKNFDELSVKEKQKQLKKYQEHEIYL